MQDRGAPGAAAVRTWCGLALDALGRARADIDAINVYPVADGDTGTNLYLTVESAAQAVDAVFSAHEAAGSGGGPSLAEAVRAMAHGALIGACGNSGTILAQLLRGAAQIVTAAGASAEGAAPSTDEPQGDGSHARGEREPGGELLRRALRHSAESGFRAVAHPVEGTVLSVATAAADAAEGAADGDCAAVARAAYDGALAALDATPGQLAVLGRAGVVDAGGLGLVAVLGALVEALTGEAPPGADRVAAARHPRDVTVPGPGPLTDVGDTAPGAGEEWTYPRTAAADGPPHARVPGDTGHARVPDADGPDEPDEPGAECAAESAGVGPAFEVIYLLEAEDAAVDRLRDRLDMLGDSLVVVGGDGLWNVHVHVDDAGAAVEAGIEAGRPYRIRITHFGAEDVHSTGRPAPPPERAQRAVVAVLPGEGLADLCTGAGATVVLARPGEPPASGELVDAIRRAHAREVVLLPNDPALRHTAAAAADQARTEGLRVALIPTRAAVQGVAALAVHEPDRGFDEDVVAMTSAAGATRYAELAIAERQSWTTAGICQTGDVLGLIDGDVAVIGDSKLGLAATAITVLDRMLAAGGELVTLVLGDEVPDAVADGLEAHVREAYLAVDTVVYHGGRQSALLLIGVE